MSSFSGLVSAGYLLKRLATKARLSLGFPLTTSVAVTNCLQPSLLACTNMASALFRSSLSCRTHRPQPRVRHTLCSCYHVVKTLSCHCQSTYTEACHVDVYAWLIFLCAFRSDLIQEVEISSWVLKTTWKCFNSSEWKITLSDTTVILFHYMFPVICG